MSALEPEQKCVFGVAQLERDDVPLMVVGISAEAWKYMADGKTHTFDLTSIGVPVRLMLFGAKTRAEATKAIESANAQRGAATLHVRDRDFGITPKEGS